ncbi:MAG: hypothetical protein HFH08_02250 [Bacilli bacterium]|nr:hypothetical protein [Bacilli bacterium]
MEHMIFLNGKQVNVIAYFMFEATRNHYLIYCKPDNNTKIYLGKVIEKDGVFEVREIEKSESFLMKKFIQELIAKNLATVKGYRYADKLSELQDSFNLIDSQEIVLDEEKKTSLEEFVRDINEHNKEILEKAKEEYYLQLVDEKAKERRTIILLLLVLTVCISLIVKMVLDFLARW